MANEEFDFGELLDQHDYESPKRGDIRTGVIVNISERAIIVDLGLKRDGIVPISDLNEIPEVRDALKPGEEVQVYIDNTDEPDGLAASIFRARLNLDWINAEKAMESQEIVEVSISGYNRGGAIAPFGNIRGFIPASQLTSLSRGMDERQRQQVLSRMREEQVRVKVIEVDRQRRRLVFSQREAEREWNQQQRQELLEKLESGQVINGRVTSLRDFGAFVDLGGIDGLIHISELAWHRVNHPRDVLKVGDEVEVLVLRVDENRERIALSRRRNIPSPWSTVDERYKENDLVEGRIVRIMDYGAFVEVEPGIEGLLHISQLAPVEVKATRDVVREDETHLLRIISIDSRRQRIGLSLKAVTVREQMDWMAEQQEAEESVDEADAAEVEAFLNHTEVTEEE